MGKFYDDLKEGFEDILAHRKGKITLRSERIEIPEPPVKYTTNPNFPRKYIKFEKFYSL